MTNVHKYYNADAFAQDVRARLVTKGVSFDQRTMKTIVDNVWLTLQQAIIEHRSHTIPYLGCLTITESKPSYYKIKSYEKGKTQGEAREVVSSSLRASFSLNRNLKEVLRKEQDEPSTDERLFTAIKRLEDVDE